MNKFVLSLLFAGLTNFAACSSDDGPPLGSSGVEDRDTGAANTRNNRNSASTNNEYDAGTPEPDASTGDADAGTDPAAQTQAQLDAFFDAQGGRAAFPASYVDIVETMLRAEDDVVAKDYQAARERIDLLIAKYPLTNQAWWDGYTSFGLNVGTPIGYYGIRMLSDVADLGLQLEENPVDALEPLNLTVIAVQCTQGVRPTRADLSESENVALSINPEIAANDYALVRQSLRLFGEYVWTVTQGRRQLNVRVVEDPTCADVTFSAIEVLPDRTTGVSGLANANAVVANVSSDRDLRASTDMWWVLYPSNVPESAEFANAEFITGGMGLTGDAALFIIDDLWLVRTPPHLGSQVYEDVQRRVYLPQWLQHEFFHHLFRLYPELGLEAASHQWFTRSTWPADFEGSLEPDYYAEALAKRFQTIDPPLWDTLRARPLDFSGLAPADLAGSYTRLPIENGYHDVTVSYDGAVLTWSNAANVSWTLTWSEGVLVSDENSPYGAVEIFIKGRKDGETITIDALNFLGEDYIRE